MNSSSSSTHTPRPGPGPQGGAVTGAEGDRARNAGDPLRNHYAKQVHGQTLSGADTVPAPPAKLVVFGSEPK